MESNQREFNYDEFICERCQEDCDDPSYQPLCPDCYHETHDDDD